MYIKKYISIKNDYLSVRGGGVDDIKGNIFLAVFGQEFGYVRETLPEIYTKYIKQKPIFAIYSKLYVIPEKCLSSFSEIKTFITQSPELKQYGDLPNNNEIKPVVLHIYYNGKTINNKDDKLNDIALKLLNYTNIRDMHIIYIHKDKLCICTYYDILNKYVPNFGNYVVNMDDRTYIKYDKLALINKISFPLPFYMYLNDFDTQYMTPELTPKIGASCSMIKFAKDELKLDNINSIMVSAHLIGRLPHKSSLYCINNLFQKTEINEITKIINEMNENNKFSTLIATDEQASKLEKNAANYSSQFEAIDFHLYKSPHYMKKFRSFIKYIADNIGCDAYLYDCHKHPVIFQVNILENNTYMNEAIGQHRDYYKASFGFKHPERSAVRTIVTYVNLLNRPLVGFSTKVSHEKQFDLVQYNKFKIYETYLDDNDQKSFKYMKKLIDIDHKLINNIIKNFYSVFNSHNTDITLLYDIINQMKILLDGGKLNEYVEKILKFSPTCIYFKLNDFIDEKSYAEYKKHCISNVQLPNGYLSDVKYAEYLMYYQLRQNVKKILSDNTVTDSRILLKQMINNITILLGLELKPIMKGAECFMMDGSISYFDGESNHTLSSGIGKRISIVYKVILIDRLTPNDASYTKSIEDREAEFFGQFISLPQNADKKKHNTSVEMYDKIQRQSTKINAKIKQKHSPYHTVDS